MKLACFPLPLIRQAAWARKNLFMQMAKHIDVTTGGQWKSDKQEGEGTMTYASGGVYEGQWKAGRQHGEGKLTYADGSVYEGQWKAGKEHGQGKLVRADGSI
jgi:hypothetical protein